MDGFAAIGCLSSPMYTGINSNNNKNTLLLFEQTHV